MAIVRLDFVLAIVITDGMGEFDADRTGDGHVASIMEQALAGVMDRDERGRAGRLDIQARAAQIHLVRDAGGQHVLVVAGVAEHEKAFPLHQFGITEEIVDEVGVGSGTGKNAG